MKAIVNAEAVPVEATAEAIAVERDGIVGERVATGEATG
jgi:hypothetical protein